MSLVLFAATDPTKPVTPAKKKSADVTAAKRSKATPPPTVSSHARTHTATPAAANARVSTKRVVVTRKKVNGKWVRTSRVVRAAAPSYQAQPEPERYLQIQQALAAKGFFKGEANGQWGDDSVDALKRYQASANLPNDGKLNSLSLIGLGLGPKHDGSITPPPSPPTSAPAAQP